MSSPRLLILVGAALAPAHAAPPGSALYWTDSALETVSRAGLDGTGATAIVSSLDYPEGISVIPERGEVWWADTGLGAILRADLEGADVDSVLTGLSAPAGLAVDPVHGKVYWSNVAVGTIHRANLDGSGAEPIVPVFGHVRNLAIDPAGGKLYFSGVLNTQVQRANLDGTDVEDLATDSDPRGLALDLAAGKLYWAAGGIHRANLDGSDPETVLAGPAQGLALDAGGGKIYWTALSSPYVRRASLDGSDVEDLVLTGASTPRALALLLPTATSAAIGTAADGVFLAPARPNPARGSTALGWRARGPASLRVFDAAGRLVRDLVETDAAAGTGEGVARWDGTDRSGRAVTAGVYFVELRSGERSAVRRVVLLR